MIYLLSDCYYDPVNDLFRRILKMGYSKTPFMTSRKAAYDTHNFGYQFLCEIQGSKAAEAFLHQYFKKYHLSGEWFEYAEEIVRDFKDFEKTTMFL